MSIDDASTGLASAAPRNATPYSVSIPQTLGTATESAYPAVLCSLVPRAAARRRRSEVLAGGDALDLAAAARAFVVREQGAHEHDALALLARDLRPVIGVRRVRQVLVLAVLLPDRVHQVAGGDALGAAADLPLDRHLLRPTHDVLDHGARGEGLEEQHLLVAVLVRHLEETVLVVGRVHATDGGGDHRVDCFSPAARLGRLVVGDGQLVAQVAAEDLVSRLPIGALDLDLHVKPAGPEDRGVDEVLAVRGPDHDHVLQALDTVDLGEELRHDRALDVGGDARPAGAEQRVHLVEEDDDGHAFLGLLPCALEDQTDLAFGLAHVLVQELGALDVEEVRPRRAVARLLGDALRERVGDGLGDERLAASRRAVEQDPLRRLQLVLVEQLGIQVRQLDGVLDLVDLVVEAADVRVRDVGDLFEDELLDLRARQALDEHTRSGLHQQVVAGPQPLAEQLAGELADTLLVGAADHERAPAVVEQLLERDDLARDLVAARQHDVQRLVEHDLLTALQLADVELGMERDPHLAAGGEHVDGAVVVDLEERAVGRRRHRELLDLLAQRADVLARLTEGRRELFVLRDGLGELTLRLEQAFLERADPLGSVLEPAPQDDDLFLQRLRLLLKLADLAFVLSEASLVLGGHVTTSHCGRALAAHPTPGFSASLGTLTTENLPYGRLTN